MMMRNQPAPASPSHCSHWRAHGPDGGGIVATGHTAIVTGANHGIGAATAQALAQRGCAVL